MVEDDVDWETSLELWEKSSRNRDEPLTLAQWADTHASSANESFAMVQMQYIVEESEYQSLERECNRDCKRVRTRYVISRAPSISRQQILMSSCFVHPIPLPS